MAARIVIRVKVSSFKLRITGVPAGGPQGAICEAINEWLGPQHLYKDGIRRPFAEIEAKIREALGPEMGGSNTFVDDETGEVGPIGFNDADVVAAEP